MLKLILKIYRIVRLYAIHFSRQFRSRLQKKILLSKGYIIGESVYFGPKTSISGPKIRIGNNVTFVSDIKIYGSVTIGNNCIFASNSKILTINHDFMCPNALPYGTDYIDKPVVIEDNVWVGQNVIIVPGVRISEGSVIGIGAVVTKSYPAGSVIGGNPAKLIKSRDMTRYEQLFAENRFINLIRKSNLPISKEYISYIDRLFSQKDYLSEREIELPMEGKWSIMYKYSQLNKGKVSFIYRESEYFLQCSLEK